MMHVGKLVRGVGEQVGYAYGRYGGVLGEVGYGSRFRRGVFILGV